MRLIFMGTPEFAVPSLRALAEAGYDIIGVYTQPDRQAGRGNRLVAPPVKRAAEAMQLPVFQPASLKPAEEVERLRTLAPDIIVVAAFGQILRANVIAIPRLGIINVHASLLPRWRGAAPITASILSGDAETGVTIMQIDPGLDTGPMIAKAALPIEADDTTGTLTNKLAELGARLLIDTLPGWIAGDRPAEPQDSSLATHAPRTRPEDAALDWRLPAVVLERRVRAFQPWPGAWTRWSGRRLEITKARVTADESSEPAGTVVAIGKSGLAVATGAGLLRLERVKLEGSKEMDAASFRAGQRQFPGARLGDARPEPETGA